MGGPSARRTRELPGNLRVGRTRRSATFAPDGWPPPLVTGAQNPAYRPAPTLLVAFRRRGAGNRVDEDPLLAPDPFMTAVDTLELFPTVVEIPDEIQVIRPALRTTW
jgi:hypothetical protein